MMVNGYKFRTLAVLSHRPAHRELFVVFSEFLTELLNPNMRKMFLRRYCMKCVPGDPQKGNNQFIR